MYKLHLHKKVQKFIKKQDKNLKQRIRKAFKELEKNPYPSNLNLDIKKLKNNEDYRLRMGKFRFLYFIKEDILVVVVEEADSRGDIYKGE